MLCPCCLDKKKKIKCVKFLDEYGVEKLTCPNCGWIEGVGCMI